MRHCMDLLTARSHKQGDLACESVGTRTERPLRMAANFTWWGMRKSKGCNDLPAALQPEFVAGQTV